MKSKGGAYVASGTYACTFSPPLSCGRVKSHSQQKLGKVFESSDAAIQEAEIQSIIRKVDPNNLFTVKYFGKCKIAGINQEDDMESCSKDIRVNRNIQLTYEYGGKALWDVIALYKGTSTSNDKFVKLFLKFEPLFSGVKRLNDMGYLHLDIKLENIVFDSIKLSLIDFGLMKNISEMMSKIQKSLLSYDYPYYPPEFKFMSVARTINPQMDFVKFKAFFMRNFGVISIKDESLIHKELERFFASYIYQNDHSLDGNGMFAKSDLYSVGVTLIILYDYIVRKDDYRTYIIKDLIKDMINCNPYERIGWDEVLRRTQEIKQLIAAKSPRQPSSTKTKAKRVR